ncbi:ATP-dependent helicase HrpB [Thiomicrorhabdus xiamenensis]|uniref:ATP-dependent helicase HrpB n=1 Tax=Thiomicrorhabdus xiamenensis TaxID=2739063 RepID=A0A7D4P591_9GAMM|nr:ATP-dependent helicase HrpB [Thiomicrorhabdus xiamenensis]QKI89475.1 ATP-dependent helicase HrpB [Thiomicrorhabdus xiamenensis]
MSLPIDAIIPDLLEQLRDARQLVLQAEPGAGKSTQVPLSLIASPLFANKKILMLEPRRLAAKRLAEFLARQLGEDIGHTVGYRIRNENRVSKQTRLEVLTEGVLTRLIQKDPEMESIGLVIFDEFHERNLQADLGLSLLLEIQQGLRDDLKCLIMSATLDQDEIRRFLPDAGFISCPGRTFPVTLSYYPAPPHTPLNRFLQLPVVLSRALQESDGDILLFLAGQSEILKAMQECESICNRFEVLALPLYGSLNSKQQDAVFKVTEQRKVIFSTNIAETSITLEGITAVIDSGLQKNLLYDPNVGMSRLQLQRVSKASATQRMGRAGRVRAGHCYRLWSEMQQHGLNEHDAPEICRADLASLRMELAQWGVATADEIDWLTPPPKAHIAAAETTLLQLQLLTEQGRLTAQGEAAMALHPEPRLAKLLLVAREKECLTLGCDLVALLQEGDPARDRSQADTVDIELRLHWLWQALRDKTAAKRLHYARWQNFQRTRSRLYRRFDLDVQNLSGETQVDQVGVLLALAFSDRIGKQRGRAGHYKLANGRGVALPENDALQSEYIVALQVDAATDSRTQQGRVFSAAALDWESVDRELPLREECSVYFDDQKQRVVAQQAVWLDQLLIQSRESGEVPNDAAQACLLQAVQKDLSLLPWSKAAQSLVERAGWLAQFSGFESLNALSEKALSESLEWLEPYTLGMSSVAELQKLNLAQILQSILAYSDLLLLDKEAPQHYTAPTGRDYVIGYSQSQAKVSLQLQQLFGELASPRVGGGQVALTFELLSPAQRPIQTTADLANFWKTSYFEVAKEMRGRYPKHRWPDEPLKEKAGASIKRK